MGLHGRLMGLHAPVLQYPEHTGHDKDGRAHGDQDGLERQGTGRVPLAVPLPVGDRRIPTVGLVLRIVLRLLGVPVAPTTVGVVLGIVVIGLVGLFVRLRFPGVPVVPAAGVVLGVVVIGPVVRSIRPPIVGRGLVGGLRFLISAWLVVPVEDTLAGVVVAYPQMPGSVLLLFGLGLFCSL